MTSPKLLQTLLQEQSVLWRGALMLATSLATVDGDFVLESGCHCTVLQEVTVSNKSFLGLGI